MGETFITASTQIDDLASKKEQIMEKAASFVVQAMQDRMKKSNVTKSSEKDVYNLIKGFNSEEQAIIMRKAFVLLAMNSTSGEGRKSQKSESSSRNELFSTRRF